MIDYIHEHNLVSHTATVGASLYDSLKSLSKKYPGKIQNLRGKGEGTFIAWDCETPAKRDWVVGEMKKRGVNLGGCGERAVRLRPMLVFEQTHADLFLSRFEDVIKGM